MDRLLFFGLLTSQSLSHKPIASVLFQWFQETVKHKHPSFVVNTSQKPDVIRSSDTDELLKQLQESSVNNINTILMMFTTAEDVTKCLDALSQLKISLKADRTVLYMHHSCMMLMRLEHWKEP